ncbi:hypothetical protein RB653_000882 [Dictyostelium firmibasis]|uniref:Exocyst complex component Sec3 C-terminal domain-containing protein n=1 Tax=Dictyostelium firmibasis TaxID=79012 RepID=A0AAN7U6J1_9MYCE
MELGYSGGISRGSIQNNRYSGQFSDRYSQYSESEYDPSETTHSESGDGEYHHSNIPILEYPSFLSQSTDNVNGGGSNNGLNNSATNLVNNDNDEDLENVIINYLSYEKDVDVLTERLGKTLSTLETEMIVGVLDSGVGVNEVISQLADKDGTHLTGVTAWIEYYNKQLQDMKKYIEHIEGKNNKMEIVSRNQRLLYSELNNLIGLMTLSDNTIATLTAPQFNNTVGLKMAIEAAEDLKRALTTKLKSGMDNMMAVKDQRKVFETYKVSFARKVATLVESIFKTTDKEIGKHVTAQSSPGHEDFPDYSRYYTVLREFKPLVNWLKEMDHDKLIPLIAHYIKAFRPIYKRDIKDFFSTIQHSLEKESKDQNDFFSSSSSSKKSIEILNSNNSTSTPSKSGGKDLAVKKRKINKLFKYALSCLESYIMTKQKFIMDFFLYQDPPRIVGQRNHHSSGGGSNSGSGGKDSKDRKDKKSSSSKKDKKEKKDKKDKKKNKDLDSSPSISSGGGGGDSSSNTTISPQSTDPNSPNSNNTLSSSPPEDSSLPVKESPDAPLDLILSEMFDGVVPELRDMVEKADQVNPFYHLTMLLETELYIDAHSYKDADHSSYFVKMLAEVQKTMKTLFNKFLDVQVEAIKSTQTSLKRCGVLAHFKNFHIFVKELQKYKSESGTGSSALLIESSYKKIILELFNWLDGLVEKLPEGDKYKFISKLENHYFFYLKLEELQINCLIQHKDTSQSIYLENLDTYVNFLIDLKFKPLMEYYMKMDELLLTLPPSDIQFQQSHSKQQFKKIVEKFKTENIEKGLLKALLNTQKNITKDSPLILVVWNKLEDVFIEKYEHFQDITSECYNQTMPVSSDQIKGLFATVYKKNPNKH